MIVRVKIDNDYSDSAIVTCGTPQGSVLGPPLFNINVRSQPKVFNHFKFRTASFADDSNGRRSFALTFQLQVLKYDIVNCLKHIVEWSHAHYMKINPDKTEILLLCPPALNKEVLIKGVIFENQCIRFSQFVKNVGVYVDMNLNLDSHINFIVSHCYKILKDIGRIKKNLQRAHIENLVHAVIASRLDYCNSLLMNISKVNLSKLQKLQNAAARLVLGKRRKESGSDALRELHWLNVDARITFKTILIVYKVIRGVCSDGIKLNFQQVDGRRGDALLLETPHFKTKYRKRIFAYNGTRLWNALPIDIRKETNMEECKKRLI